MIRWGILGPGKIAKKFAADLVKVEGCKLQAVGSRSIERAQQFAQHFGDASAYGSYQELVEDPEVDIIYIATPHDSHLTYSLLAMKHGKHVLCEKPLAINSTQVRTLIDAANQYNVFLMEAFWARFNPVLFEINEEIKKGVIGQVNYIHSDFSYARTDPDTSRLLDINLAGGALMDMGVYPVFLAYQIMGMPTSIKAVSTMYKTGVDIQTSAVFDYPEGVATIMTGFRSDAGMESKICGTEGRIVVHPIWHEAENYSIIKGAEESKHHLPKVGFGYTHEILECVRCIENGQYQSQYWSHKDSLNMVSITDEIRQQIGLKYPFE